MISIDGDYEFGDNFHPRSINNDNHAVGVNNDNHTACLGKYGDRACSPLIKYEAQKPISIKWSTTALNFFQKLRAEKIGSIIDYIPVVINNKDEVVVRMIINNRFQDLGYSFLLSENGPRYFALFNGYAAVDMNDNAQVILTTEIAKDPASWAWEHGEEVRSLEFKEKMKYPSS